MGLERGVAEGDRRKKTQKGIKSVSWRVNREEIIRKGRHWQGLGVNL